jgi:branched-chain amino acid aminotransferase
MIFLNNKLVRRDRAVISVFDHGFLYGDGIYETLRAYNGIVFKLDEHIQRLYRSASLIQLNVRKDADVIKNAVYQTLQANRLREAVIRVTVSRGAGPAGLDPELCKKPTFVIFASKFREYPGQFYQNGVPVAIVKTRRNIISALNPQIKSLNFLNNVLAKIEAKRVNAFEALMLNYRGYLAEGTVSNVFFLKDGILCTPGLTAGILGGITRKAVLDIARKCGFKINQGKFGKTAIYGADEVFLSNTTMEVMPVSRIDNVRIAAKAGKTTNVFRQAYKQMVADYINRQTS